MKHRLALIALPLLLTGCNLTPGQGPAAEPADSASVVEDFLGKLGSLVEKDIWYSHDFSFVCVMHKYMDISTRFPQADETILFTRVGDKFYIQTQLQGVTKKLAVYEAMEAGYKETIYEGGRETWSHEFDNSSLDGILGETLRTKYPVGGRQPENLDLSTAKEGICCGRPCLTAEIVEEKEKSHITTTVRIDREYGFLYSVTEVGKNQYGYNVNITPFEVKSFTDKPTAKDIPSPKNTENPMQSLKKQLQNQLDAAR